MRIDISKSRRREVRALKFREALQDVMQKRGDIIAHLAKRTDTSPSQLSFWLAGRSNPRSEKSFAALRRIEADYGLRDGYLVDRAVAIARPSNAPARALDRFRPASVTIPSPVLAYHLPDTIDAMGASDLAKLKAWLAETFVGDPRPIPSKGEIRRFVGFDLAAHSAFADHMDAQRNAPPISNASWSRPSPPLLIKEWKALTHFKTAAMTPLGYSRDNVWSVNTTLTNASVYGCAFAALLEEMARHGPAAGAMPGLLSFALLTLPRAWDCLIDGAQARKGRLARTEVNLLRLGLNLLHPQRGWLTQSPWIATGLRAIPGLSTPDDVQSAQEDWIRHCALAHRHIATRIMDVKRRFEPTQRSMEQVAAIIECDDPIGAYRAIAENMWSHRPNQDADPVAFARFVRSYVSIRLVMHTGLRSTNIRELRYNAPDGRAAAEDLLRHGFCGELRKVEDGSAWEVFVPRSAFKNAKSKLYRGRPFRMVLPDVDNLYERLALYVDHCRSYLAADVEDPGWLFINRRRGHVSRMSSTHFHAAWHDNICKYGIYNPWTGRGVIAGLKPHGPHAIRAVLATQIYRKTGSIQIAAFAIQDHPATVERFYLKHMPIQQQAILDGVLADIWKGP